MKETGRQLIIFFNVLTAASVYARRWKARDQHSLRLSATSRASGSLTFSAKKK